MSEAGRPSKFDPDFHPESFIELSKEGKTLAEICAAWGICRDTLWRWSKDKDRTIFSDAIKIGLQAREAWFVEQGKKIFRGEIKGNPAPWVFIMKNCFKWSDKNDDEPTDKEEETVTLTTDQLLDLARGARKERHGEEK